MSKSKGHQTKKLLFGSLAVIAVTTLAFGGISQWVKAAEIGKTEVVPTSYSLPSSHEVNSQVPEHFEKRDYHIKFVGNDQPTPNDLDMKQAAELASQHWWRIFQLDVSGKTLEVSYSPVSDTQQRARWNVRVEIHEDLAYDFSVDAITGENHAISRWIYYDAEIPEGMDVSLIHNNQPYQELAKEAATKYQLLSGEVTAVEYAGQAYFTSRTGAKNASISFRVTSDTGEEIQISFSRYNQELLSVEFGSWLKEADELARLIEQQHQKWQEQEGMEGETDGMPLLLEIKE